MDTQKAGLTDFIYALVERLMMSADFCRDDVMALLAPVLEDIRSMQGQYGGDCPAGAEAVQSLMAEMTGLYEQSLMQIVAYLGDDDESHLQAAVGMAEEASDLLTVIEDVIQTNKDMLSEMVDA